MLMHLIAYLLSAIYGCQSPYPCSPFFAQSIFSDTPAPVASHRGRCVHSGFISKLHQILHLDNGHICDTCVGCPDQCIRYFFFIMNVQILIQICQLVILLIPEITNERFVVVSSCIYDHVRVLIVMWKMLIRGVIIKGKH